MDRSNNILKNLPKWLSNSNNANNNAIVNAIGSEIDLLDELFENFKESLYINSASTEIPYMIYKCVFDFSLRQYTIECDYVEIANSVYSFFTSDKHSILIDYDSNTIYLNKKYDNNIVIKLINDNNIQYINCSFVPHHIWNCFDEFALMFSIKRRIYENGEYEDNESLKKRIFDAINNRSNSSIERIKDIIANELNIQKTDVDIVNIFDIPKYNNKSLNKDFIDVIKAINEKYKYNKFYWDTNIDELTTKNLSYAPRILFNALDNIPNEFIQNGVGDNNDLEVDIKNDLSDEQQFNLDLSIIGKKSVTTEYYPAISLMLKSYATGKKILDYPENKIINYSVLASEKISDDVIVTAKSKFEVENNVDFNGSELFNTEIVKSNKIFGFDKPYIITNVKLYSNNNRTQTPIINSITIKYKDTNNNILNKTVNLSQPTNNIDNIDGKLKLSKGTYSITFNSSIAWQKFNKKGLSVTPNGVLMKKKI